MKFDYIIVGAGSAGCVLANRLSSNPKLQVLLIEAGREDSHPFIKIPAAFSKLFKTKLDWNDVSVEQLHLLGQKMYCPRGKVIGGSSSMNAMIFIRPHESDFKYWNVEGWNWDNCLPHLIKVEKQFGFQHLENGEAESNEPYYVHPFTELFLKSAMASGFQKGTCNSSIQKGAFLFLRNIKNGKRFSAADAYLHPIRNRSNLKVLTNARMEKIQFKENNAQEIIVHHHQSKVRFQIGKELILAGGSFQTPAILQRSGIGSMSLLEELKIPPIIINDHVGQNLQDHLICGFAYRTNPHKTLDTLHQLFPALREGLKYMLNKRSELRSNIAEAGAYLFNQQDEPDLQFHFGPAFFIQHGFVHPEPYGISFGPTLIRPKSHGYVHILSTDPFEPVCINPQYYSHPDDMMKMMHGLKMVESIVQHSPLKNYIQKLEIPESQPTEQEDYFQHLRQYSQTLYHPVGTCRMGAKDAVVRSSLLIHGIQNVRIADASILPKITSSNTNAVTMMIAEKASEMILQETH